MSTPVELVSIQRGLALVEAHLRDSDRPEALLARAEAGIARPEDAAALDAAITATLKAQHDDGSWGGGLLDTAEALLHLHELRSALPGRRTRRGRAQIARALDWIRSRRGLPGRFSDGCDPERHELAVCHHFLAGFFSPAPPEPPLEELRLVCGAPVVGDRNARLAASCVALQAKLRWKRYGRDVDLHLEGLRRIIELAGQHPGLVSPPAFIAALAAVADAPGKENRQAAANGIAMLISSQRGDGTWPDADLFHVLELLERTARRRRVPAELDAALRRAAYHLAASLQEDGTWGQQAGARRTLIGWRALRYAAGAQEKKSA
ncbi:MAG TPA: hypothetical protein VIL18_04050 [Longimicrobiales bacterium]